MIEIAATMTSLFGYITVIVFLLLLIVLMGALTVEVIKKAKYW